jgi:hypothetical protein
MGVLFRAIPTAQNRALTVLPMVERECAYATLAKAVDRCHHPDDANTKILFAGKSEFALSPVNISILTISVQPPDLIISAGPCTAMTSIHTLASAGVCFGLV